MTLDELQHATHELAIKQSAFETEKHKQQQDLESKKLALTERIEEAKLRLEIQKSKWTKVGVGVTAFSIMGSVLIASVAFYQTQKLQKEATDTQFALKAADIVLQSDDPIVNANKAARFQDLFPKQVPPEWKKREFDWGKYVMENDAMKEGFAALWIEYPKHRAELIEAYKRLFNEDTTVPPFLARMSVLSAKTPPHLGKPH